MIKNTLTLLLVLLKSSTLYLNAQPLPNYDARCRALVASMGKGAAIVFAATPRGVLNKNFYYLTGKSDLSMILISSISVQGTTMLLSDSLAQGTLPKSELSNTINSLHSSFDTLWVLSEDSKRVKELLKANGIVKPVKSSDNIFYAMREIKDDFEQHSISKAVDITAQSYNYILSINLIGLTEQQIIDRFKQKQQELGAQSTSFIQAGSGENGTQVHASPTQKVVQANDMIVFDVGAWFNGYTSDISRSVPANGKFTKAQKTIYQLVLDAQKAAIATMIPGAVMRDVQLVAENKLIAGLSKLGLITDTNSPWQRKMYIVHGFYHYIGLDVHDLYRQMYPEVATKKYAPGMIMTMEPGLYFPSNFLDTKPNWAADVPDAEFDAFVLKTRKNFNKYRGIGVRIEDDVLITPSGNKVLSAGVPKEIKEIEKVMRGK
jgi:Xaa-Pro aminopeptidase